MKAPVSSWLISIARNQLRDGWRRLGRIASRASPLKSELVSPLPCPETSALLEDQRRQIREATALLNKRERELIALRFGGLLSITEISIVVGRSQGAVAVALHRAIKRIRILLKKEGESR
jgi:RNA polymerase sigma factor (sigma-70 family)